MKIAIAFLALLLFASFSFALKAKGCKEDCPLGREAPVCAGSEVDGNVPFVNACAMNHENCHRQRDEFDLFSVVADSDCKLPDDTDCEMLMCNYKYIPLCATDGVNTKTFASPCRLGVENCQNKNVWFVLHYGEC